MASVCAILNAYAVQTEISNELFRSASSYGIHCSNGPAPNYNSRHNNRIGLKVFDTLFSEKLQTTSDQTEQQTSRMERKFNKRKFLWSLPCSGPLAIASFPVSHPDLRAEREENQSDLRPGQLNQSLCFINGICRHKYANSPLLGTFLARNPLTDYSYTFKLQVNPLHISVYYLFVF